MGDELNQHVSSQPSNTEGTNDAGKPSEPVASGTMTDSQSADYFNKTQQLAQERRAFEAKVQQWEQERGGYQQYAPQQYPQQQQNYGYSQQGMPQQDPNDPNVFGGLVKEFGYEGAKAMLQSFNQITQPVQQQLAQAQGLIQQTQAMALMGEIKARGKDMFGPEWSKNEQQVMGKILQHGIPLEDAWAIVTAPKMKQAAIDQAYQNQTQKQAANVAGGSVAPSNAQPTINSFDDAFKAAWAQHSN